MDRLKDFLTFLRNWQRVKKAPLLSVGRSTRLLRKRNPRRLLPIPPYQRGPMGGYLVPFKVEEPKRYREWIVWIEMFAPTLLRPYWLPVETELTLVQVAAMTKLSPSRIYGRLRTHPMRSARKRGTKWIFVRDEFLRYDLPELDPDCDREPDPTRAATPTPGFRARGTDDTMPSTTWTRRRRAGRHSAGCDGNHDGACPVPPRAKKPRQPLDRTVRRGPRWTADAKVAARRKRGGVRPTNSDPAEAGQAGAAPTKRPTITEAALRRMAGGDPAKYAELAARHSYDIETDRDAGWMNEHLPEEGYIFCLPERPTSTEARLWRLAGGDPSKYTDLAIEYSDEIAADRAAGRFAPKTPKKR